MHTKGIVHKHFYQVIGVFCGDKAEKLNNESLQSLFKSKV